MIKGEENYSIDVKNGIYFGKERIKVIINDDRTGESMHIDINKIEAKKLVEVIREKIESKEIDFRESWNE